MTSHSELKWLIKDTATQVAEATEKFVIERAQRAIAKRGCFHLVLAGGTTPRKAYEKLATHKLDWSAWRFYYGDERCLPTDDPERNSLMAEQAWLQRIRINPEQHFPIPAELGPEAGAEQYLQVLETQGIERFDLVLLGMGEDGHTASLFPGHEWSEQARMLAVHDSPKPPPERVSLGPALIHAARRRCFIVTGGGKAAAVQQWREDQPLPIQQAASAGDTVIIDRAAWGMSEDD
jgi:6-phosphogluconolactonase